MIVGITGAICAGKAELAMYLVQTHGFEAINVLDIFKIRLAKLRLEARARREARKANGPTSEERKEEEEPTDKEDEHLHLDKSDHELGIEMGHQNFCYAYYSAAYKSLRKEIIREIFRDLTGKWNRHFVVYPLSPQDDIQLML